MSDPTRKPGSADAPEGTASRASAPKPDTKPDTGPRARSGAEQRRRIAQLAARADRLAERVDELTAERDEWRDMAWLAIARQKAAEAERDRARFMAAGWRRLAAVEAEAADGAMEEHDTRTPAK